MLRHVDLKEWLIEQCAEYKFEPLGLFNAAGEHEWPLVANSAEELAQQLADGGHLLPLPKESAALANVLEVSIVDFLMELLEDVQDATGARGTERGYPDLEVAGDTFGGGFHAVDIKVARRKILKRGAPTQTQSRITLYTGNTYFKFPTIHWAGTPRPFADYESHLDVIGLYTLDEDSAGRVVDLELLVQEPWRIASRTRSSTTREYIGAVVKLDDLREGRGEFTTPEEFYTYWRKCPFKTGRAVEQQLARALRDRE